MIQALKVLQEKDPIRECLNSLCERNQIRRLFEEETQAFTEECGLVTQQYYPLYSNNPSEDICAAYQIGGVPGLRRQVAITYAKIRESYQPYATYLLQIAADPSLP